MIRIKQIFIVGILFSTFQMAFSQPIVRVVLNDTVQLQASTHRGNIQWQVSLDNQSWNDITNATEDSFGLGENETIDIQWHFESETSSTLFQINSEAGIVLGGELDSLGNNDRQGMTNNWGFVSPPYNTMSIDDFSDVESQILPAEFSKDYKGLFFMKYKLTQNQYVDFLSRLSTQTATNCNTNPHNVDEAFIKYKIAGTCPNNTILSPHVTVMFVKHIDGASSTDWIGLRPVAELEFEKVSRVALVPVMGEYASGVTNLKNTFQIISDAHTLNEGIMIGFNTASGNVWYSFVNSIGAVVCDAIFVIKPNSAERESSGATYCEIMEMSGNCCERTVTVDRTKERAFQVSHDDRLLNIT